MDRRTEKNKEIFDTKVFPKIIKTLKNFDLRATSTVLTNSFVPVENTEQSVYLHGQVHAGKTVDLCRRVIEWARNRYIQGNSRIDFRIVNFQDFLQQIKNTYEKNSKYTEEHIIAQYRTTTLLAIDDVGNIKNTDWSLSAFYSVVNYRYSQMKLTYYTSNFEKFGIVHPTNDLPYIFKTKKEADLKKSLFLHHSTLYEIDLEKETATRLIDNILLHDAKTPKLVKLSLENIETLKKAINKLKEEQK